MIQSADIKLEEFAGTSYEPLPKDVYQVQLIDILPKTRTKYQEPDVTENVLEFTFAVLDEAHYGRRLWKSVTQKLVGGKKPSGLYTVLSGLTGKELSQAECMDAANIVTADYLNALIGKQVRLSVGQKVSETSGKTNNIIESYLPVKEDMPAFDATRKETIPF